MYDKNLNTPEVFLNKDFIGVWDNVIKDDFCNFIIKTLNESTQIVPRSNTSVKDTQLDIAAFKKLNQQRDIMIGTLNQIISPVRIEL